MWKLDGTTLTNKGDLWKSADEWNLKPTGKLFYIENISKNKVLGVTKHAVNEDSMVQNDAGQMWKKGETNDEGYFTLINPRSKKVLTAISAHSLGIEGMLTNSKCTNIHKCIYFYIIFFLPLRKLSEV